MQLILLGKPFNASPLGSGYFRSGWCERERSDLDPFVADVTGKLKRLVVRPILEGLVADGEFHLRCFRRALAGLLMEAKGMERR